MVADGLKVWQMASSVTVMSDGDASMMTESRAECAGSKNGSTGLSELPLLSPCAVTIMEVALIGRGKGVEESSRLRRLVELVGNTRIGLCTTLFSEALSFNPGEPRGLDGLFPMWSATAGMSGKDVVGLGFCGGTSRQVAHSIL
jgi:hypothetical protein